MNRKGITHETVAGLILVLAGAAILLGMFVPKLFEVLKSQAEVTGCEWSIVKSSLTRFGGFESIPVECKAKRIDLTGDEIVMLREASSDRIKDMNNDVRIRPNLKYFRVGGDEIPNYDEFTLNGIIAKELAQCWDKVLKGKPPIFDQWWSLLHCKDVNGALRPCKLEDFSTVYKETKNVRTLPVYLIPVLNQFNLAVDAGRFVWKYAEGDFKIREPPVFCILCSRISFDNRLKFLFRDEQTIRSLPEFMKNTPDVRTGEAYWKYISDGQTQISGPFQPSYEYSTNQNLAVLYQRVNPHQLWETGSWVSQWLGFEKFAEPVSLLKLVPYGDVMKPLERGGGGCAVLIG